MKKPLFLTTTAFASLTLAALASLTTLSPPVTERMPFYLTEITETLGWFAQRADVIALADVIEDGAGIPDHEFFEDGFLRVRVVNAIYGCTNGQELVIRKFDPLKVLRHFWVNVRESDWGYDPNFEYYPTNLSRIVFAATTRYPVDKEDDYYYTWSPKVWRLPPEPEIIVSHTNKPCIFSSYTRSWWHEDSQEAFPYAQLTNLVHAARVERNWTNYYYICRDTYNIPNLSARAKKFALHDVLALAGAGSTSEQRDFILNDPLLHDDCRKWIKPR